MTEKNVIRIFQKYGQTHVLEHYRALSPEKRRTFLEGLGDLDFDATFSAYHGTPGEKETSLVANTLRPAAVMSIPRTDAEKARQQKARTVGEALLRDNKVGVLIVAGGQGSRLGFNGPKGVFPISPVKNKTLFCLFCEAVKAMSIRYEASIPLVIMTSMENDRDTRAYFESSEFFGLKPHDVHFFRQGMLPSVTLDGELMLNDETHLFINPDGHGGSLKAIHDSGLLEHLVARGITELFYCQVDNPLARIADPVFLGYHCMAEAEISTKVVRRVNVEEKVGVYVSLNGREAILEYSDLGGKHMSALDEAGEVLYWAGNTAIHALSLSFIKRLNHHGFSLPYHRAHKTVEVMGPAGSTVSIDGLKFETFVFDAIPLANRTCCMEVSREEEFSPVKNREGTDSPDTARKAMSNLFRQWTEEAGVKVAHNAVLEVSPLFALDQEELASKLGGKLLTVEGPTYFGE